MSDRGKQRLVIIDGPHGETIEVIGYNEGWSLSYSNDFSSLRRVRLSLDLCDASVKLRPARRPAGWDRFVAWLEQCPLMRRPETMAHPIL